MLRPPPLVRFAEFLKFFGLLIVVSIGLMAGFIDVWWEHVSRRKNKEGSKLAALPELSPLLKQTL